VAKPRHLTKAPITEAIIDLRAQVGAGATVESLRSALQSLDFGYEPRGPILRGTFGFSVNVENEPAATASVPQTSLIGVRFDSKDGKYVAQFSIEGFTLSRLAPYESWDPLIVEAQRLWKIYRQCAAPSYVTRAATRFINNLQLPLTQRASYRHFLQSLPDFSPEMPQMMSRFIQQFYLRDPDTEATVIFSQALDQAVKEGPVPIIVDVDVYRDHRFPATGNEVWEYLNRLRELKNRVFFSAITEEAAELYA